MNDLLKSCIIGACAGIAGTGLGGAAAFLINRPSKRFMSTLMSFSAGLMIAVVCFDLIPESMEIGGMQYGILGIILGVMAIILLEELLSPIISRIKTSSAVVFSQRYIKTGIMIGIGIGLHNFPEGLAIGSGFTVMEGYGISLGIIIALHDIPEGISLAAPMCIGGLNRIRIFVISLAVGFPTALGAVVGYLIGGISNVFISICLGFAAGAMLYITCSELIPESRELHKGRISSIGLIAGLITGLAVTGFI